jgi:uncharacterized protein YfeS
MNTEDIEHWELSLDNCHPNAAQILTDDFYWDTVDENSPFGNDTGADTLHFFHQWRVQHPNTNPIIFLEHLLKEWNVTNDYWELTESSAVSDQLEKDEFSFNTRDEALIALAFGQLAIESKIDPEVRRRTLSALRRQAQPAALSKWGRHSAERVERLGKMKAALEQI